MLVEATLEQIRYAEEYQKNGSLAHRGKFDGGRNKQLTGIIAQIIIADILGLPRPINENKFDGGFDILFKGKKWDVKTECRTVKFRPHFVHNLCGYQIDYDCYGYIFVSAHKKQYDIRGWITKEDLKSNARFFPEGSPRPEAEGRWGNDDNAGSDV